jgi:putative membrane protein
MHIAYWRNMKPWIVAAGTGLALALVACGQYDPPRAPEPPPLVAASAPTPRGGKDGTRRAYDAATAVYAHTDEEDVLSAHARVAASLTNDQILEITRTADVAEIEQAHLAHERSMDPRVQKLAATMMRDYVATETEGDALANKVELNPEKSPTSESLESETKDATRALKAETGLAFDAAYVDTQVREHRTVLDMLSRTLIPSSTDISLSAYLRDVRASVEAHLEDARDLQRAFREARSGSTK